MEYIGYKAATAYGYSSTRVKAMESKLLSKETLSKIAASDDISSIIGILLQTDYKEYLTAFGDMNMQKELIDFALVKSLESSSQKLIKISPKDQKEMTTRIVNRSDAQNIKLLFYAKAAGKSYEDISRYVIESINIDSETMKRALAEQTLEEAASKLIVRSPYRKIIESALESYKKNGNITEVNAEIDRGFFKLLDSTIKNLMEINHESATVIRLDIEMRNILTLLRAKRYEISVDKLNDLLLERGLTPIEQLLQIFESSKDIVEIASKAKSFDLKNAIQLYEGGKGKKMLFFEISMRNSIFKRAIALLRHSTLSFGVILGYFYLKEIEIFTLRVLINGKSNGLSGDQIAEMIIWDL